MKVQRSYYLLWHIGVAILAIVLCSPDYSFCAIQKNAPFFQLSEPNARFSPAKFKLQFTSAGNLVYFVVKNEWDEKLWDNRNDAITITKAGWTDFTIPANAFAGDSIGKFLVICYNKDPSDENNDIQLWRAWFIRDHEPISKDNTVIKAILDKYSPYVHYGNYLASQDASKNPWNYESYIEKYYPIDIRELATKYAPFLVADGAGPNEYHLTVGVKKQKIFDVSPDIVEYYLDDANIISLIHFGGIDISSYNDALLEYGITRIWTEFFLPYELLEIKGPNDSPYVSEINLDNFTHYRENSKIYGTAYQYGDYIFVQYFFYYPFDPKIGKGVLNYHEHLSRHSADRERVVVVLKKTGSNLPKDVKPLGVLYFHHLNTQGFSYFGDDLQDGYRRFSWNYEDTGWRTGPGNNNFGGAYVNWEKVSKTQSHPHVYIAQGSHGCYFRQGSYVVDIPETPWPYVEDLKEYAGGQGPRLYKSADGSLVYLPRLSEIDTEENNTEFSFLLFSGIAAQTENLEWIRNQELRFPPQDDVWYAVERYCPVKDGEIQCENNVSKYLRRASMPWIPLLLMDENGIEVPCESKFTVRMSLVDDLATLYINGSQLYKAQWGYFGTEPDWYSIGHQPGDSGEFDICPDILAGMNTLRFTLQDSACCGTQVKIELKKDGNVIFSDHYNEYHGAGLWYDKTVTICQELDDSDGDCVLDDGDESGTPGDKPCTGGDTVDCDDNCPNIYNPNQADSDGDGIGDICEVNLNDGLVAYYPFNGNANDESGNGNDGTVNGATLTVDRLGTPNSAYSFDGVDDEITTSEIDGFDEVSISVWIYPLELKGSTNHGMGIVSMQPSGGNGNWKLETLDQGKIYWEYTYLGGGGPSLLQTDQRLLSINTWDHIVAVRTPNSAAIYLNGELVADSEHSAALTSGRLPIVIGNDHYDASQIRKFHGVIDEVRIYNRSLTQAEIRALANE